MLEIHININDNVYVAHVAFPSTRFDYRYNVIELTDGRFFSSFDYQLVTMELIFMRNQNLFRKQLIFMECSIQA